MEGTNVIESLRRECWGQRTWSQIWRVLRQSFGPGKTGEEGRAGRLDSERQGRKSGHVTHSETSSILKLTCVFCACALWNLELGVTPGRPRNQEDNIGNLALQEQGVMHG